MLLNSRSFVIRGTLGLHRSLLRNLVISIVSVDSRVRMFLENRRISRRSTISMATNVFLPHFALIRLLSVAFRRAVVDLGRIRGRARRNNLTHAVVACRSCRLTLYGARVVGVRCNVTVVCLFRVLGLSVRYSGIFGI